MWLGIKAIFKLNFLKDNDYVNSNNNIVTYATVTYAKSIVQRC